MIYYFIYSEALVYVDIVLNKVIRGRVSVPEDGFWRNG